MAADPLTEAFVVRLKLFALEWEFDGVESKIQPTSAVPMDEDPAIMWDIQTEAVRNFLRKLEAYNADVPQQYNVDSEETSASHFVDVDLWFLLLDIRGRIRYTAENITKTISNRYGENYIGYTAAGLPIVSEVLGIVLQPPQFTVQLEVVFTFAKGAQTRTLDLKYFTKDDGTVRVFLNHYWTQRESFESNFRTAIRLFFEPPQKGNISCNVCGIGTTRGCAGCKRIRYCGEKCQKDDWVDGHSKFCGV